MSLNHFSSSNSSSELHQESNYRPAASSFTMDAYQPQLYHQNYHQPSTNSWLGGGSSSQISQPSTLNFNLNHQQHSEAAADGELHQMVDDKEAMFEKPLTPSDVGKLNRLVIPKQHAEKYFPLGGCGEPVGGEKGLLLSFEDESGKCWRFRYSYWNSSQSYVLTKGWSRYVKEKRLDAGDVVFFERFRNDSERFFIGWRRRAAAQENSGATGGGSGGGGGASNNNNTTSTGRVISGGGESGRGGGGGGGNSWNRMYYSAPQCCPAHHHHSVAYPADYLQRAAAVAASGSLVQNQTPSSSSGGGNSRILRLFGVNLECQQQQQGDDDHHHHHEYSEPSTPDGSSLSSQGPTHHQFYPNNPTNPYYEDHRDFTSTRDAMRNRRG